MARKSPIGAKELLQLPSHGIDPSLIKFNNVTLQSSKYVCVRDEAKKAVTVIDLETKKANRLPPLAVDSAIMNPISYVIALRAKNNLQIFNLEMKNKMKSAAMTEDVVFWRWIDPKTLAIVTANAVYHWSMDGDAQPEKIFDRAAYEGAVQIINYRATPDKKWLMLGGIAASPTSASKTAGVLQVYSVDAKASQPLMDSHAATFARVTLDGKDAPSDLFCFTKPTDGGMRLMILEVGGRDQKAAFKQQAMIAVDAADFPVSMLPDDRHGTLFIITKQGLLFLYEIQSGKRLFGDKISQFTMFASVESSKDEGGVVTVDQKGRVAHLYIDRDNIVDYVTSGLGEFDLGVAMARRYNLPGAGGLFKAQFDRFLASGQFQEAMDLAISSPQGHSEH